MFPFLINAFIKFIHMKEIKKINANILQVIAHEIAYQMEKANPDLNILESQIRAEDMPAELLKIAKTLPTGLVEIAIVGVEGFKQKDPVTILKKTDTRISFFNTKEEPIFRSVIVTPLLIPSNTSIRVYSGPYNCSDSMLEDYETWSRKG